jgi:hypothetical protein
VTGSKRILNFFLVVPKKDIPEDMHMKGSRWPNTHNQPNKEEREEQELAKRFKDWEDFLNAAMGVLSLNFALACLGTHRPSTYAAICFVVVLAIRAGGEHLLPKAPGGKHVDAATKARWKAIARRHMPIWSLFTRYLPFLIGFLLLISVVFGHLLALGVPAFEPFIDDYLGPAR